MSRPAWAPWTSESAAAASGNIQEVLGAGGAGLNFRMTGLAAEAPPPQPVRPGTEPPGTSSPFAAPPPPAVPVPAHWQAALCSPTGGGVGGDMTGVSGSGHGEMAASFCCRGRLWSHRYLCQTAVRCTCRQT
ncbi:hypothetical protein VULLAG_LOCUS21881 [Vulpes lagopus]